MAEPEKVTRIKPAEGEVPARKLPFNLEAEAAFLGAVLIDNRVIEELQVPIRPEHFFEALHARIYERVLVMIERNATASPVTCARISKADEALKELGGTSYLAQLTASGAGLLAPRELAQQIYDLALLRELVSVGRGLVEGALDTSEDTSPMDRIAQAEADLFRVAEGAADGREAATFREAAMHAIKMAEKAMNSGGPVGQDHRPCDDRPEDSGPARFRPHHPRRAPRHGQDLAGHQHRLQLRRKASRMAARRGRVQLRSRRSPSSASK
jgi:replicative DNA helicase